MSPTALELFEESLARCGRSRDFLDRFYERFMSSSPRVREKFAKTDFAHQKRALRASFHMLLLFAEEEPSDAVYEFMDHLAERHADGELDIDTELYDLWFRSLLETVREHDPEFDPAIEEAWERVMAPGIEYLVNRQTP